LTVSSNSRFCSSDAQFPGAEISATVVGASGAGASVVVVGLVVGLGLEGGSGTATWVEIGSRATTASSLEGGDVAVDGSDLPALVSGMGSGDESGGGGSESWGWLVVEGVEVVGDVPVELGEIVVGLAVTGAGGIGATVVGVVVGLVDSVVGGHVLEIVVAGSGAGMDGSTVVVGLSEVVGGSLVVLGSSELLGASDDVVGASDELLDELLDEVVVDVSSAE
jgi:hypothetical protein